MTTNTPSALDYQRAIYQLVAAVENLLPGARHIPADIGLINDALLAARPLIDGTATAESLASGEESADFDPGPAVQAVPSGAVDEEFTTGDTYPAGDCDMFEAGIHHKQASGDQWQQRIVVYGDTPADAEALRDRVLASLTAAPKAEQAVEASKKDSILFHLAEILRKAQGRTCDETGDDIDVGYECMRIRELCKSAPQTPATPDVVAWMHDSPGEVERPVAFVKYDSPIKGHTEFMRYEPWMDDGLSTGWIPLYSSQLAAHRKQQETSHDE